LINLRIAGINSPAVRPMGPSPDATSASAAAPCSHTAPSAASPFRPALGQQAAAQARQHVARAGRGQGGAARGVDHHAAILRGDDRARAFQHHDDAQLRCQLARRAQAVGLHLRHRHVQQARRFQRVRRQDRRPGPRARGQRRLQFRLGRHQVQRVRVQQQGAVALESPTAHREA